jgi:hypothetical protein
VNVLPPEAVDPSIELAFTLAEAAIRPETSLRVLSSPLSQRRFNAHTPARLDVDRNASGLRHGLFGESLCWHAFHTVAIRTSPLLREGALLWYRRRHHRANGNEG